MHTLIGIIQATPGLAVAHPIIAIPAYLAVLAAIVGLGRLN